ILLISINLIACESNNKERFEGEFLHLFDTATRIIGYADSKELFSEYVQGIYDELEIYHQFYDIYNDYEGINNIKTINDNAGIQPVKVDQKIIDLLKFGKEVHKMSHGGVNIAMGSVLKIWHEYRERATDDPLKAQLPPMDILEKASEHIDIEDMIIDEVNGTVYLADSEMSLDVGGIAKGYATEQVSRYIVEKGFTDGIISVGGNVRTFGHKGREDHPWSIGIQNPESGESDIYTVQITDKSLVTSGDYIRYYTVDGKRYHHIIDPETLLPSDYFTAVTIICEDSGMADALSTMIFNMPFDQGLDCIEKLQDTEAVWIYKDGQKKYSSGFKALLK
ncbi:MAG TPA: FAD:protein FMN transferase, partial [Anaerovoracaceae bacterium]|nr:FAD:protein FMN transferase [Anaerovoracaceae bacterium]